MGDKHKDNKNKRAPNQQGKNPSAPGQGGGKGDTRARSDNPNEWKNEPGNQN